MDVFMKFEFDLKRLHEARSTKELQFASIDLAVWGFHMIDWVLASVGDEKHIQLAGRSRKAKKIAEGFIDKQIDRLGTLPLCQQVANTSKHRVLTWSPDDPTFSTHHTIRFVPPFDVTDQPYRGRIFAEAYLRNTVTGDEVEATKVFTAMVEQWREFLKEEKLYDWHYDYEPPETD